MFEVNFILITNRTFTEKNIPRQYIYHRGPLCLCDTATSFFHHVIQDKETRPTGTICSVSARILVQKMMYVN